jgi:hypothetical protein
LQRWVSGAYEYRNVTANVVLRKSATGELLLAP